MSSIRQKIDQLSYYAYLINPLIEKKYRICRSFARWAHKYYDFLEESQWWSIDKLKEYQDEKLRNLISHAYKNVPYYREIFNQNRIKPEDIRTSNDLVKLPILTKDIIRENFPDKIVIGNEEDRQDGMWTTGGSTGEPLKFYADMQANNFAWTAFFRFFRWHGYEWGDMISIFFRPFSLKDEQPLLYRYLDRLKKGIVPNVKYYDGSRLSDSDLALVVEDLIKSETRILRGYPSALTRLAEYCRYKRVTLRPKFITTTGETLFGWQRDELKKQFYCNVFDQYGCAEIMGVSFECGNGDGLHVTSEHCIVEVVDKNGNILPPGDKGILLLTDLDNYKMPFIRYMVGDEGSIKDERCGCGRNLPLMDNIIGRECDMIRGINGRVAHGLFFVTLLQDSHWFDRFGVRDFEVVQREKDSITLTLACKNKPGVNDIDEFIKLCQNYFGNMKVELSFVDEIPRTQAAKRRYTRYEVS
jgi:phenylacetate-CoA ligase